MKSQEGGELCFPWPVVGAGRVGVLCLCVDPLVDAKSFQGLAQPQHGGTQHKYRQGLLSLWYSWNTKTYE